MGFGYRYHCNNCGKDFEAWVGVGMSFPDACEETLEAVKQGKLGQGLKEAAEREQYVGVDAAQKIYVCDCCSYWDVYADATIYGLADKETGSHSKLGEQTIEEWGFIPHVSGWEDEIGFRVVKEFAPLCKKCGGAMHAIEVDEDSDEAPALKCNNCGSDLSLGVMNVYWD